MQITARQHLAVRKGEKKERQEINLQQMQLFPEMQNKTAQISKYTTIFRGRLSTQFSISSCTSKCMQRRTWNTTIGTFMKWPPMSCRLHILACRWSPSEETIKPLFKSRYLTVVVVVEELGSLELLWMTGFDHFVHTRNAKHSAILQE